MVTRTQGQAQAGDLMARLASPGGNFSPYPIYEKLRALGPAVRTGPAGIAVTRYASCAAILRDGSFGAISATWRDQGDRRWRDHPALVDMSKFMILCDPPEHTRLRTGIGSFFSPGRVRSLRPVIDQIVADVVAEFAAALDRAGTADFVELVAARLPMRVIGRLLGIPARDYRWLISLLNRFAIALEFSPTASQLATADEAALMLRDYMANLLTSGSWEPGDNAITAWTAAAAHGDLAIADVANAVPVLFAAGSSPARLMLGNLMWILTESPELIEQLRESPELSPSASEECARLDTPIQMVSRLALRDTEVCDVQVRQGEPIHVLIGSANRDPLRFDRPDQADFRRTGPGPLSYGQGIHRCLGSAMATMQTTALLPVLVRALPPWRFADPPVRYPGTAFRGFLTMPVTTS